MIAMGGAFAIEGAVWAIFPSQTRRTYNEMMSMGDKALHMAGLASVAIGVVLIALAVKSVS